MRYAILVLFLTSCATPQERAARFEKICSGYGFAAGTQSFDECKIALLTQRGTYAPVQKMVHCQTFGAFTQCF